MATKPTATEVRTHLSTDLVDAALDRLIDDSDAAVTERYGAHASTGDVTELHAGGEEMLFLDRPTASITSVTEVVEGGIGESETVLAADDYRSWWNGRALQRLDTGTNERQVWGSRVTVVHTPVADSERRTRIIIDLVKLALAFSGHTSEKVGDVSMSQSKYQEARNEILGELQPTGGIPFR